jgi:hypothetical protein
VATEYVAQTDQLRKMELELQNSKKENRLLLEEIRKAKQKRDVAVTKSETREMQLHRIQKDQEKIKNS